MMGSCSDEEEDRFFDTREDITSVSDSGSDCPENYGSSSSLVDHVSVNFQYEQWIKNPGSNKSIRERRNKFLKWMGMSLDWARNEASKDLSCNEIEVEIDRITESSGAVLRTSDSEDGFLSSRSSMSCWSNDAPDLLENGTSEENFVCRIKNLDDGTEFIVDELGQDGVLGRFREVGSNRLITVEEFQRTLGLSPLVQQFMQREVEEASNSVETTKRGKKGWLRRLGAMACLVDSQREDGNLKPNDSFPTLRARVQRIRVRPYRKKSKEFSALYMGQDIQAHEGSILTMKFSLDEQYLASAGEDGIVRVWQVMEEERSNEIDMPDIDPSCLYFTVNHLSELVPLFADKEKMGKLNNLRKTSDSACVIFPPKVFRISEKALHEFHGHSGEVLDLSWSKKMYLLSSSVDKTVRLWQMGCNQCLRVFSHNNYVTCIQFNPVDDNYFISGSIDGKVRIWAIPGCQVVDWTSISEIVTAVCYRPDGQGGIVGTMTGNCRFYNVSDNHLQLDAQICIQGRKKSPWKRITGFQFSPSDPSKVMVTSADSQVRILHGVDVICKYRGLRNAGSQLSASFTSDGKHIVSASEDSNVYMWNYFTQGRSVPSQAKSIWSCERFFSNNTSIAIPWCGIKSGNSVVSAMKGTIPYPKSSGNPPGSNLKNGLPHCHLDKASHNTLPFSSPDHFSLSHGLFPESLPKGCATWPEEKLPPSSSLAMSPAMCKSQYKFLKSSCQSTFSSPHVWGLVIVTAGWDGRIRSFHNYGLPIHL
ncbi:hypothetical protein HHK36_001338 [Tetracentron sinense]|uniref:Uncharacterized protein n=1 Tax=Tetracentron sinense TaxID=13715 RepID=A0A835DRY4_TETSI|nr:hypothetical protein HHK36_001338 [Tetracentron sinense]